MVEAQEKLQKQILQAIDIGYFKVGELEIGGVYSLAF